MKYGYVIYSVSVVKIIEGGKYIIFDGLSGIGDVNGGVHEAYPTALVEWFSD